MDSDLKDPKITVNPEKIEGVLNRGVEHIYPEAKAFETALSAGKRLRIYHGIDPTGKLHLGHMVALRKLRQLQDLGHEVIVLIGDFTATIGDPTDKLATRKPLTREQVLANAKNYKVQIGKILDLKKSNVRFLNNAKWTDKLMPKDMLELASKFTIARLLERDMFQNRIKEGKDIHVHEFLYPIFQAYDSVTMDVDAEVGGNDQTFNMLAGRDLIRKMKGKEKFVIALKLLVDPSGKKMGKTEGNMVNLDESPGEMFGKIMSWPDGVIMPGLETLTDIPMAEIKKYEADINAGILNPKIAKAKLASEIIKTFYSEKDARSAEEEFERVFGEHKLPSEIPTISLSGKSVPILDLLFLAKLVSSKSEAKRMILQKGVKINDQIEEDWTKEIRTEEGMIIQVGKRKFAKVI